tara:strand:+ start:284 stop:535 length:252 start_codon:yes stop_codon:yes gene_type:complete
MTEKQINEKLIIALEEKIQLLEEQKVTSQKIIDIQNEQLTLTDVDNFTLEENFKQREKILDIVDSNIDARLALALYGTDGTHG